MIEQPTMEFCYIGETFVRIGQGLLVSAVAFLLVAGAAFWGQYYVERKTELRIAASIQSTGVVEIDGKVYQLKTVKFKEQ